MGMFDFLKGRMGPAGQAPVMATGPAGDIGPLAQPPTMQHQPGFLERQRMPGPDGISMADRILMGMMSLNGNTEGALGYAAGKKKEAKSTSDRTRKNAALKAAYKDGKFEPEAYMAGLGDDGDYTEALSLQKELAPKTGVDGSFAYSIDHNGQVHWGEQRGMSHAEEAQLAREAEAERRNRELEDIARGRLGVAERNAATGAYRAHKGPSGGSGAAIPPPPGGWRPAQH